MATELYVVYTHLRRLGFIVRRHRAPWVAGKPGGMAHTGEEVGSILYEHKATD